MTTMRFTEHARRRCAEMGLTTKQVKHAMRSPESTYPAAPQHGNDCEVSVCGLIAVVHDGDEVVTVLWNRALHGGSPFARRDDPEVAVPARRYVVPGEGLAGV